MTDSAACALPFDCEPVVADVGCPLAIVAAPNPAAPPATAATRATARIEPPPTVRPRCG